MSQDLVRLVREARVAQEHNDDDFRASSLVAETGRLFRRPYSQAGKFILCTKTEPHFEISRSSVSQNI